MEKNVLIITGSPRREGNSNMLSEVFAKGVKEAGHRVTVFDAGEKDMRPCIHCDKCWSGETACAFQDGFTQLETMLEQADEVVLVSPLYWFTFTSQIKRAIDRLYAYCRPGCLRPLHIKKVHLITCGADGEEEAFEGIRSTFRSIAHFMKWQVGEELVVMNVSDQGDVKKTGELELARKTGQRI